MTLPSPNIAAIILAAGQSQRMGARNKLLAEIKGKPMIRRVVEQVEASKTSHFVVVTGHNPSDIKSAIGPFQGSYVQNPRYSEGLSSSLRCGIEALGNEIDGALVVLGDMPEVSFEHMDKLIETFDPGKGIEACLPVYQGKRGNPVLWGRKYFKEIRAISGDKGARELIKKFETEITLVNMPNDGIFVDVDTPEALAKITKTQR